MAEAYKAMSGDAWEHGLPLQSQDERHRCGWRTTLCEVTARAPAANRGNQIRNPGAAAPETSLLHGDSAGTAQRGEGGTGGRRELRGLEGFALRGQRKGLYRSLSGGQ